MGAKYWGYETSRHRAMSVVDGADAFQFDHEAYHWFEIGLKSPAHVERLTVSTRWFTGNQVPAVSIVLLHDDQAIEVISRASLAPDQEHVFDVSPTLASRCLVKCYHEGGIARVNLFGQSEDMAAQQNLLEAAQISHISNEHYGRPHDAVAGNRQVDYMFGWESARTGFGEMALFHLVEPAVIRTIVVDTYLHRLNPPLSCHVYSLQLAVGKDIDSCMAMRPRWTIEFADGYRVQPDDFKAYMQQESYLDEETEDPGRFRISLLNESDSLWQPLISFGRLRADTWHRFDALEYSGLTTHLLYMHFPNGGIHGLKAFA
jgi:allantoicase